MAKGKARIAGTHNGWHGYLGRNLVAEFGCYDTARQWLEDQVSPRQDYGHKKHPVTGVLAAPDKMWVRSVMGPWCEFDDRTSYTCSPSSETYWSS